MAFEGLEKIPFSYVSLITAGNSMDRTEPTNTAAVLTKIIETDKLFSLLSQTQSSLEKAREEITKLKFDKDRTSYLHETLNRKHSDISHSHTELKSKFHALEENFNQTVNSLTIKYQSVSGELREAQIQLKKYERELKEKSGSVPSSPKKPKTKAEHNEQLQKNVECYKQLVKINALERQLQELQRTEQELRKQNEELSSEKAAMQLELSMLQDQVAESGDGTHKELEELKQSHSNIVRLQEAQEAKIWSLVRENTRLAEENSKLKASLEESEAKVAELRSEVRAVDNRTPSSSMISRILGENAMVSPVSLMPESPVANAGQCSPYYEECANTERYQHHPPAPSTPKRPIICTPLYPSTRGLTTEQSPKKIRQSARRRRIKKRSLQAKSLALLSVIEAFKDNVTFSFNVNNEALVGKLLNRGGPASNGQQQQTSVATPLPPVAEAKDEIKEEEKVCESQDVVMEEEGISAGSTVKLSCNVANCCDASEMLLRDDSKDSDNELLGFSDDRNVGVRQRENLERVREVSGTKKKKKQKKKKKNQKTLSLIADMVADRLKRSDGIVKPEEFQKSSSRAIARHPSSVFDEDMDHELDSGVGSVLSPGLNGIFSDVDHDFSTHGSSSGAPDQDLRSRLQEVNVGGVISDIDVCGERQRGPKRSVANTTSRGSRIAKLRKSIRKSSAAPLLPVVSKPEESTQAAKNTGAEETQVSEEAVKRTARSKVGLSEFNSFRNCDVILDHEEEQICAKDVPKRSVPSRKRSPKKFKQPVAKTRQSPRLSVSSAKSEEHIEEQGEVFSDCPASPSAVTDLPAVSRPKLIPLESAEVESDAAQLPGSSRSEGGVKELNANQEKEGGLNCVEEGALPQSSRRKVNIQSVVYINAQPATPHRIDEPKAIGSALSSILQRPSFYHDRQPLTPANDLETVTPSFAETVAPSETSPLQHDPEEPLGPPCIVEHAENYNTSDNRDSKNEETFDSPRSPSPETEDVPVEGPAVIPVPKIYSWLETDAHCPSLEAENKVTGPCLRKLLENPPRLQEQPAIEIPAAVKKKVGRKRKEPVIDLVSAIQSSMDMPKRSCLGQPPKPPSIPAPSVQGRCSSAAPAAVVAASAEEEVEEKSEEDGEVSASGYDPHLPSNKIDFLFGRLINYSLDDKASDDVAEQFLKQDPEYVAMAVLTKVSVDKYDQADTKYSPAPLMTDTQRIMLGFMMKLERLGMKDLVPFFMGFAEKKILTSTNDLEGMTAITRLYLAVCKLRYDIHKMRRLCCEMFFFGGDFAVPFLFTVLSSWPEVLPHCIDDEPIAKVLVQIVYMNGINTPGYNLLPLREMLTRFYKYPGDRWDSDELFKELFGNYIKKPVRSADYALLLLCKNHPDKWVIEKIDNFLKPLVEKVPSENFKATVIILIGYLSTRFSPLAPVNYVPQIRSYLLGLVTDTTSDLIRRSVYLSINKLRRKK